MQDTFKHKGLRNKLVKSLKLKGIAHEGVLQAMEMLPRHFFIAAEFEHFAYDDKPFPIGEGQTISQPFTVAYQTMHLDPKPGEKVLEIGTGSGYQAAILSMMGAEVYSVERWESLYNKTKSLFEKLNIKVKMKLGDGTLGWSAHAPYDKILVTAGAPKIPEELFKQLKVGGWMIIPVGDKVAGQKMIKLTKTSDTDYETLNLDNFKFVPLIGKQGWGV